MIRGTWDPAKKKANQTNHMNGYLWQYVCCLNSIDFQSAEFKGQSVRMTYLVLIGVVPYTVLDEGLVLPLTTEFLWMVACRMDTIYGLSCVSEFGV